MTSNRNFFGAEFYPTPQTFLNQLDIDCNNKICLEPSAGSGNIIEYLKANGAKKVYACEKHQELAHLAKAKASIFLGNDCLNLTEEDILDVNLIIMNPPFSEGEKHVLHLHQIAPEGCEIKAILPTNMLENTYNSERKRLSKLIHHYGYYENYENAFSDADRQTNVDISFVTIVKPILSNDFDFDGFLTYDQNQTNDTEGIVQHNELAALVNKYLYSIKALKTLEEFKESVRHCDVLSKTDIGISFQYNKTTTSIIDMKLTIKERYWNKALQMLNIDKYVTSGVSKKIQLFAKRQAIYPFSLHNIYRMVDIIFQTKHENMKYALAETIDKFTQYTHENRYGLEGWKTNLGHLLNTKFIINNFVEPTFRNPDKLQSSSSYGKEQQLTDLVKALCYFKGLDFDEIIDEESGTRRFYRLQSFIHRMNGLERGRWYSWGFFEIKAFKKGTVHFKFQNNDDWKLLNQIYAEVKGEVLPESI